MSGRADVVSGSPLQVSGGFEHGSGVGPAPTREHSMTTTQQPLTTSLVLAALPTAPSCARLHVGAVLREWGLRELVEAAELVVSELVTNAVQAVTDPAAKLGNARRWNGAAVVRLRLVCDTSRVVIEVWDTNPQPPIVKEADLDSESGRG